MSVAAPIPSSIQKAYSKGEQEDSRKSELSPSTQSQPRQKNGKPSSNKKVEDMVSQFAYLTRAGKTGDGVTKTNQDNFFVVKNFAKIENLWYFGVADGHG